MPIALLWLPTARRTRGADVALTWRGVRPHTPIGRTYATGASPPLGRPGGRSRS